MKLSVSLSAADVQILDTYVRVKGLPSRSAAVQFAVRALQLHDLEANYEAAWNEWARTGDQAAWDVTAADGVVDAAR